jgi:hypothetical protein
MSDAMIEAVARAIAQSQSRWIGCDPGSPLFCRQAAQAAIAAAAPLIREQVEREIVEWLQAEAARLNCSKSPDDFAAADELTDTAIAIERGDYRAG